MAETYVTSTALISCTFGAAPSPLMANPARKVFLSNLQKLNVSDFVPLTNIQPFGMCSSPANPAVISATVAALGVFTQAPCVPVVSAPWIPGSPDMLIEGMPALTNTCHNMCIWGGQISFNNDGQIPIPPPVVIPPLVNPFKALGGKRKPLTPEEESQLSENDRQEYKAEMAQAEKAGANDQKMGEAWKKTADAYTRSGQPEKAAAANEAATKAFTTSLEKRNAAIGDVNQKFRGKL